MLTHKVICSLALCFVLFSSCVTTEEKQENNATIQNENTTVIEAWQGNLDGKIPVLMWYKKHNGVLRGQVFYTNQNKPQPITIIGTERNNKYDILEILPEGKVTGVWSITPEPSSAEGFWFSPEKNKSYSTSLMHIDTGVSIDDFYDVKDVTGTYKYSLGTNRPIRHLTINNQADGKYAFEFQYATGTTAHNLASIRDTVSLQKNIATFKSNDYGKCSFTISFYQGFAIMKYANDTSHNCGIDHNAEIDGVYLKQL